MPTIPFSFRRNIIERPQSCNGNHVTGPAAEYVDGKQVEVVYEYRRHVVKLCPFPPVYPRNLHAVLSARGKRGMKLPTNLPNEKNPPGWQREHRVNKIRARAKKRPKKTHEGRSLCLCTAPACLYARKSGDRCGNPFYRSLSHYMN